MIIKEFGLSYWIAVGVLALLVASPLLSRVLVYPQTEFFTELWILDADHKTENYPSNITRNQNYSIYLNIGNRLGHCAYYMIQVKFRNQTQEAPTTFGSIEDRSPSNLSSLFNITTFVADKQVWKLPLTFSFDYTSDESLSKIDFSGLMLNDTWLNMTGYTVSLDSEKKEFRGFLFFELWLYNASVNIFQYHGLFVSLRLNLTRS